MAEKRVNLTRFVDDFSQQALSELLLNQQFRMVSCSLWNNQSPWRVPERECPDSFFLFPVRGKVRVTLESGTLEIGHGEYLMLPDRQRHALELVEGHTNLQQYSIHCHIYDRYHRSFMSRFRHPVGTLSQSASTYRALKELACLMSTDPMLGQHFGQLWISKILSDRLKEQQDFDLLPSVGDPRIARVLHMMENGLDDPLLSIEALAANITLSTVQMRKIFVRQTGTTPKAHLQKLRLRKASRLLLQTESPVKEIASACGFNSDAYFFNVFRRHFACTPLAYRNRSESAREVLF